MAAGYGGRPGGGGPIMAGGGGRFGSGAVPGGVGCADTVQAVAINPKAPPSTQ